MVKLAASGCRRETHIGPCIIRIVRFQMREINLRQVAQGVLILGRHRQHFEGPGRVAARIVGASGAAQIKCTFVPLMPNALTPAILFAECHGMSSVGTRMGQSSQGIRGLGSE